MLCLYKKFKHQLCVRGAKGAARRYDMVFLDLTLPTPEANLACDEALLDQCDAQGGPEVVRVWVPPCPFIVLGYADRAAREVNLAACTAGGIPVLRRISGGGTVLQAPGCLNYALVLRTDAATPLRSTRETNVWVMERHRAMLERLIGARVVCEGVTDLAIDGHKVSGNAQRRKSRALLFHGTFLLQAPVCLMEQYLQMPSRAPAYRLGRSHREFVGSLWIDEIALRERLRAVWEATQEVSEWPRSNVEELVQKKYTQSAWNLKW